MSCIAVLSLPPTLFYSILKSLARYKIYVIFVTLQQVAGMIRSALNTYDADKTGKVDFALESAGTLVVFGLVDFVAVYFATLESVTSDDVLIL